MAETKVPSFRRQKRKNKPDRAFVELNGRRHYLGDYDDPRAKQQYHALIAEWMAHGGHMPVPADELTVTTLCARFYQFADGGLPHVWWARGKHKHYLVLSARPPNVGKANTWLFPFRFF